MRSTTALLTLVVLLVLTGCQPSTPETPADAPASETMTVPDNMLAYGDVFDAKRPMRVAAIMADGPPAEPKQVTLEGEITKVCQMRGCWIGLDAGDGEMLRVNVPKDSAGAYVYTFDTDLVGQQAIVHGWLEATTVSVETRRHLAADEGASEAEQAAITEPSFTMHLTATGALVAPAPAASTPSA